MHLKFFEKESKTRSSNSLFQTARDSEATLSKCTFPKKCTPLEYFKKHYMVSLRKHSEKAWLEEETGGEPHADPESRPAEGKEDMLES